jgi:hypothetical protein
MIRIGGFTALVLLIVALPLAKAADNESGKNSETAALAFVQENHPELAALLAQLKAMRPAEYDKAIRELAQTSKSLGEIKERNPRRYQLALESWKKRSHVQLLAARLAGVSEKASTELSELESQLRQAAAAQVDVEIARQKLEKRIAEENLAKAREKLESLESRRQATIDSRVEALLRQSRLSRKKAEATRTRAEDQPKKKSQAKDKASRQDTSKTKKEEPQP